MKHPTLTKKFLLYISLNILSMLGVSFYILADTFFIAKYVGGLGLTALNLVIPIYFLFISAPAMMLGVGGAAHFSILLGKRRFRRATHFFHTSFATGIIYGITILALSLLARKPICLLLGANPESFQLTLSYYTVLMLFAPVAICNNILLNFIRNDNNPRLATTAMIISNICNVIGDYILMGPLHLGIVGAALATAISPIVSIAIQATHFSKNDIQLHFSDFHFLRHELKKMITTGIPAFINDSASGIIVLIFNLTILRLAGNMGVAAYGVVANLNLVVIAIFSGISMGIQPLVSFAYGANDTSTLQFVRRHAKETAFILGVIVYAFSFFFTNLLIDIFNSTSNPLFISLAFAGIRLYFISYFFAGFNLIEITYLAATTQSQDSTTISIARSLVLPLLVVPLGSLFHMTGVWLTMPIAECLTLLLAIFLQLKRKKAVR